METDIWPRRNLPDLAEEWGRQQEIRADSNSQALESLQLSVSGANRATASSLESIARQLQAIEDTQSAIVATQAAIVATQAETTRTTQFLQSQSVFDSRGTVISYVGVTGGTVWESFNPAYDVEHTITTAGSGRIIVSPSARLVNVGSTCTPALMVEVVGAVPPPADYYNNVSSIYFAASGGAVLSRQAEYALAPNTTYTVRTRRGRWGSGSGECNWGYQSLGVTRLA